MAYHGDFEHLSFSKKGQEIIDKAKIIKVEKQKKIDDRKSEIQAVCKEFNLTAEKLFMDLDSLQGHSNAMIPSAEMSKVSSLARSVKELEEETKRLDLMIRNLDPKREFELDFSELTYFRF